MALVDALESIGQVLVVGPVEAHFEVLVTSDLHKD